MASFLDRITGKAQLQQQLETTNSQLAVTNKSLEALTNNTEKVFEAFGINLSEATQIDSIKDFQVTSALSSIYSKIVTHRTEIVREVQRVRHFYISQVILDQFAEDALSPDVATGDILEVTSEDKKIKQSLDDFDAKFGWDRIVNDFKEDLLSYGEYTLGIELSKTDGITKINDDVEQERVVAITEHGEIVNYLVMDDRNRPTLESPDKFVKFMLGRNKIRVNLQEDPIFKAAFRNNKLKGVPRFVRVGRSVLWPIISKIKELELLEQLIPASVLTKLSAGTIIGVTVAAAMNVDDAFEACKKVEQLLNKKIGLDVNTKELTVENIMNSAGRMKAVPVFGDKGQLQRFDYKPEEPENLLSSVEDIRRTILSSVGIPYELIYGGDESKGAILKRYARYIRKLKAIQSGIVEGVRTMAYFHLINSGHSLKEDDITITFRNKLVQVDVLDELEFLDTTVGMIRGVFEFFVEDEMMQKVTRKEPFLKWMDEKVAVLGLKDVVDISKWKKLDPEGTHPDEEPAAAPPAPAFGFGGPPAAATPAASSEPPQSPQAEQPPAGNPPAGGTPPGGEG